MSGRPSMDAWGNRLYTGQTSYDFVGRRRFWFTVAVAVIALSLVALLVRGFNLGIEFSGGSEFRVSGVGGDVDQTPAEEAVQSVVSGTEPRVSTVGTDSLRVQTGQLDSEQTDEVRLALAEAYGVDESEVAASFVGPSWGQDISESAVRALLVFLVLVSITMALYFRTWKMAVAAIVAVIHDVVVTVGIYALVGFEVTPASVIGLLTILGYSLYDTVVVFDKIRENTEHIVEGQTRTFAEAANLAVNQTLVRSVNTSVVALLPIAAILFVGAFILGAGTLRDLALALFVGVGVGAYSSLFIAPRLLVALREREPAIAAQAQRVAARRSRRPDERVLVGAGAGASGGGPAGATAVDVLEPGGAAGRAGDADGHVNGGTEGAPDGPSDRGGGPDGQRGPTPPGRRPPLRTAPRGGQRPQPRRGRPR